MLKKIFGTAIIILLVFIIVSTNFLLLFHFYAFKTKAPVIANLYSYLNGGAVLNESYYSQREIAHLYDVRNIIFSFNIIFICLLLLLAALIFICIYKYKCGKMFFSRALFYSAGILLLLLLLLSPIDFDSLFIIFHRLLFTNDLWLLAPDSTLIQLFPEQFFSGFALRWGIMCAAAAVIIIVAGWGLRWNWRVRNRAVTAKYNEGHK